MEIFATCGKTTFSTSEDSRHLAATGASSALEPTQLVQPDGSRRWSARYCRLACASSSLGMPYPEASWRALPEMWQTLLRAGRLQLFLVEDRSKQCGSRIIACCAAVYVTDAFCAEAQSTLPPYLGVQLARLYLSQELPVLSRAQIARANAEEGLNLLVCFEGLDKSGLSRDQFLPVREKQCEAFQLALYGYRVKEFLANPIGKEAFQETIDAGARLRRDYTGCFQKTGASTAESSRPWLVGLTKEEAEAHPGSHLAGLFGYIPPRFRFSGAEQRLLQHALTGETSAEEAAALFISPWTVKKRWHAIYERVADIDRELLPSPMADRSDNTARGAERRRHLLHYLRQHPEELRPFGR